MTSNLKKPVSLFYVPFTCKGFTESLLKMSISEIKGNDYSKILYLSPTPGKIRESQRVFHKLTKTFYIPPEMLTIKQFSKKLYSLYGNRSLIPKALIPIIISRLSGKGLGFAAIISSFIDEIKQYRPDKDIEAIQNEIGDVFTDFNVPEEGSKRAMEAIEVFRKYQEVLNERGALDENDILQECPRLIEKHNYTSDILILDSFYEITPAEELILGKLIEQSKSILISIPYSNNYTDILSGYINFIKNNFNVIESVLPADKKPTIPSYTLYPGIDEEVEGIARHIKNLYISGKYKSLDNIILTFPKLNMYEDIIRRVFKRYGIPCNFSKSKPLVRIRPFLDLIAMLESVADDYQRLPFSQFLVSPYFKKLPDVLRKYIPQVSLNSGIIKGKNSWINLTSGIGYQVSGVSKLQEDIKKYIKWVFKRLDLLEAIKENGTCRDFSDALYKLIDDLDFSDKDTDFKEQLSQALKELSLIDNLIISSHPAPLSPGERGKGLRHFIDNLKHILSVTETEMEGSGVQVNGFFEMRGIEPEYLYFGGLKDGDLPSMPEIDHILPDNVRTKLGLVNMKRYLHLQKFIFHRLIDSSRNLHLSYPAMEADKLYLPSPFLPWRTEASEKVPGILCKEEELLRSGKLPLASHIKEIDAIKNASIKKQFGKNANIRVTDIDSYRTCPRKFFIEKILNLEPLEIKEYEVEAKLLGTIIHHVMEDLISKPFINYDEMTANAEEILKNILDEQPLEDYWKNLIKDTFLSILPEIYETESKLKEECYSFMKAEVPVEGEVIKDIKLRGKIDRADKKVASSNEIELIDYKTGSAYLSRTEILNKGATLQLFLYAALMKMLGFKVNRVGIYSLKDIEISWIPKGTDKKEGFTIENYITASLKYLEETISKIRKGDFTAIPLNEQTCRNCNERPYCPHIQT